MLICSLALCAVVVVILAQLCCEVLSWFETYALVTGVNCHVCGMSFRANGFTSGSRFYI